MPKYSLVYKSPAVRSIQKLSPQIRKRLRLKLEYFVAQDNPLTFAKALTKPADAQYRFRVGNYRVLFDIENDFIVILLVQHLKDIYRK